MGTELIFSLENMKNRKHTGPCGKNAELLKYVGDKVDERLLNFVVNVQSTRKLLKYDMKIMYSQYLENREETFCWGISLLNRNSFTKKSLWL